MDWMRLFLPAYSVIAGVLVIVARVWLVWRETGVWPVASLRGDDARGFVNREVLGSGGLMAVSVVLFAVGGPAYQWIVPLEALVRAEVRVGAAAVLVVALILVFVAQGQMRRSWRIGVDAESRTELVTAGLFSRSRNPVFVGVRGMLIGAFLAHPNVLSLLSAVLGNVLIEIQVRLEEQHLEAVHGETYRAYRQAVRRWF